MENITNILYSLLPLILIILFSWLFGLLGSKAKKQQAEAKVAEERQNTDLLDLILSQKEEEVRSEPGVPGAEKARLDEIVWEKRRQPGGPIVSPDPIKPRWWGA